MSLSSCFAKQKRKRVNQPPTCALSEGKRAEVHRNEIIRSFLKVCGAVLGVERWSQQADEESLTTSVERLQHGLFTTHSPRQKKIFTSRSQPHFVPRFPSSYNHHLLNPTITKPTPSTMNDAELHRLTYSRGDICDRTINTAYLAQDIPLDQFSPNTPRGASLHRATASLGPFENLPLEIFENIF